MTTEHLCDKHPEEPGWRPGKVDQCPYHGQRVVNQTGVRWGRNARRKMDHETGVVGKDRGGYISG